MVEQKAVGDIRSLELRIAELEDKLAKLHVSEEEMKAYEKVSALMGGAATAATAATDGVTAGPTGSPISRARLVCINRGIRQIQRFCYECTCGPCAEGGGYTGGGGFGGFGY